MNNNPNINPVDPTPKTPNEGQNVKSNRPDTEVNPGDMGNDSEVDLDKQKTQTYPKTNPPEKH